MRILIFAYFFFIRLIISRILTNLYYYFTSLSYLLQSLNLSTNKCANKKYAPHISRKTSNYFAFRNFFSLNKVYFQALSAFTSWRKKCLTESSVAIYKLWSLDVEWSVNGNKWIRDLRQMINIYNTHLVYSRIAFSIESLSSRIR